MKRKLLIINCSTHQWPHMPVGTNGISFLLKKNQVKHTVLSYHNQNRRETYEVLRSLIRSGYDVILLFHWKEQIKTFFELSRYIKYFKNKNSVLCAAGMSAGFFYKQILLDENLPDLVFIGDSEKSIIDFSKNIPIEKISNIAYIDKKNKKIIKTKSQDHSMDTKTFSNITYTYFENIYNKSNYINFIFCNTCFYINLSRGCDKKCLYCGGSIIAFKHCSGRNHSVYRNINSVINDIVYLFKKNKNIFKNNPVPIFIDDFFDNYILVLKKLSDINLSPMINIVINERGLLDKEKLIKNISVFYSFNKVSFEVSPETELDYQRKKLMPDNTRNMYKNEYLIKLICFLREHNFYCSVYYTMFNSFDTKNDILNRLNFIREMKFKYED